MSSRPTSAAAHREQFALALARAQAEGASARPPAGKARAVAASVTQSGASGAALQGSKIAREIVSPRGIPAQVSDRTGVTTRQLAAPTDGLAVLAGVTAGRVGTLRVDSRSALRNAAEGVLLDALNRRGIFMVGLASPPATDKLTAVTDASRFVAGARPLVVDGGELRSVLDLGRIFGMPSGYVGSENRGQALLGTETVARHYGERAVGVLVVDELSRIPADVRRDLAYALGRRIAQGDLCDEARPTGEPSSWVIFALGNGPEVTRAFLEEVGEGVATWKAALRSSVAADIARGREPTTRAPADKPLRFVSLVRFDG